MYMIKTQMFEKNKAKQHKLQTQTQTVVTQSLCLVDRTQTQTVVIFQRELLP